MISINCAGMHRGVRDLAGGDQYHTGECAVQPVPRGQNGELAHLEHGQDHDRRERRDLRYDCRRGDHLRGRESTPRPQAAYPAQYRSNEDGRSDCRPASQLLFEHGSDTQPRRAPVVDGHSKRLQRPERVGPGIGLQQQKHSAAKDFPYRSTRWIIISLSFINIYHP